MARSRVLLLAFLAFVLALGVVHAAPARATEPQKLFALDAKTGSLTPVAGKQGVFDLVLDGVRGKAIYFTDRPAREVGTVVVRQMLRRLFAGDSPDPNAAVNATAAGRGRLLMGIEMLSWRYDARGHELHLRVRHLPQGGRAIGKVVEDTVLPRTFADVSVFIDDCCSVVSRATVFNPTQLAMQLSINNGEQTIVPGTSPETWLPGSASIEFSAVGAPQPGVLAPGANFVSVVPTGALEPINFQVDIPGNVPYRSVQLYVFLSVGTVSWTLLNNGMLVASGSAPQSSF